MGSTSSPHYEHAVPHTEIPNSVLITSQLRRAWCLMLTRAIWPTISWDSALHVARWVYGESNGEQ